MTETISDLVSIRELETEDLNFILDSFISCISKYHESIVKGMNRFYVHSLLEKMMLRALNGIDYSVYVCSHKDDSRAIIAYIIANPKTNHIFFQYTKYSYRKLGIQKYMLLPLVIDPSETITVQWPTKEMLKLAKIDKVSIENRFLQELMEKSV